jgi:vitamin B12 transporter
VDLVGSFDLSNQINVYARIGNLLNRHYENPTGFLQPSVGAFAGIKAKF